MEGRQANLGLSLTSFAVRLCFHSVEAHLFAGVVSIFTNGGADFPSPCIARTTSNAASANAIEATAEEEEKPGGECEPDSISD